jgi:hypothetical protein
VDKLVDIALALSGDRGLSMLNAGFAYKIGSLSNALKNKKQPVPVNDRLTLYLN